MSERDWKPNEYLECVDVSGLMNPQLKLGKLYKLQILCGYAAHIVDDTGMVSVYHSDRFRRPAPAETREVVRYKHDSWPDGNHYEVENGVVYDCRETGERFECPLPSLTPKVLEDACKCPHWTRTVIRPAPAPAKAEAVVKECLTTEAAPLPRQPHEPETIALMRPEELRQFRAGQERRKAVEVAAEKREADLAEMRGCEHAIRNMRLIGVGIAAYRALCCEKGGEE